MTFDRLVRAVDDAVGRGAVDEEVFAQVGCGGFRGKHMKCVETLPREEYAQTVRKARALIGHAGMGTIRMALEAGKPLLVMPRRARLGEVVNDHQTDTARKFAQLRHVLLAEDESQIFEKLAELRDFVPEPRVPRALGVIERVKAFLDDLTGEKKRLKAD